MSRVLNNGFLMRFDHYDSEQAYNEAIEKNLGPNQIRYLPSPQDIEKRKSELLWLQQCGFNSRFIASVMQFEMPRLAKVRKMVDRWGADETYNRLLPFLSETEYDDEC
jgi:hypothetical protein